MLKRSLIAGVVLLIVGMGINWVIGMFFPGISAEYQNPAMFRPWTDPLMMVYFGYPFILGFVLYYFWGKVGKPKAFEFAKLYFLIATVPGMFITYTSFQVSLSMVLLWAVTGFLQVYIAGLIYPQVK